MTAAVEAVALSKRYRSRYALQDCDLVIPAGKVVGLVGPNRAGKTTLLQSSTNRSPALTRWPGGSSSRV